MTLTVPPSVTTFWTLGPLSDNLKVDRPLRGLRTVTRSVALGERPKAFSAKLRACPPTEAMKVLPCRMNALSVTDTEPVSVSFLRFRETRITVSPVTATTGLPSSKGRDALSLGSVSSAVSMASSNPSPSASPGVPV